MNAQGQELLDPASPVASKANVFQMQIQNKQKHKYNQNHKYKYKAKKFLKKLVRHFQQLVRMVRVVFDYP